ncbi:MAG: hydantoinase/oxoprolinase family protein [Zhengella sp.]|uniref:hydantoinase/oxoprolinase N-terminal domain-containing protein n=1 Tax=Zhengella sp. TaxID=2282762 RepID=UPI003528F4C7|nr:hydantoinase/oxoprolinase family protein [Brucellaceae bacterium]
MTASASGQPVFLGIDTGGTYTDAVLWREGTGVIARAKALTTRHDLAIGIAGAARAVIADSGIAPGAIALASLSTTLATNALVEGQGAPAALVMIGFEPGDLERDGLARALGGDPVVFCPGGHDIHARPRPLELAPLEAALDDWSVTRAGVAVAGLFAVRNSAHEEAAARLIAERTGLPVTCSHHLTSKLGGPRRALTTLLNARLVPMIGALLDAMERFLAEEGITAPLMVVRGDGALVSAAFARQRPIETILSGPAASLAGARALTGLGDAFVSDIGGTTTDVAVLDKGLPRLDPEGAMVGGWRTMVEAVAMRTFGLGGDSEVSLADGALEAALLLGPRRVIPLSLAETLFPGKIAPVLERQLAADRPSRQEGRFAWASGLGKAEGLGKSEQKLLGLLTAQPQPLDRLLTALPMAGALSRLVARGLAHVAGFTPSDAAHAAGRQENWNRDAARLATALFMRRKDGRGRPLATSIEDMANRVLAAVTRRSAEVILETALVEDGLDGPAMMAHPLAQRALDGTGGFVRASLALDRPVIGLGASAGLHYADLEHHTGAGVIVPDDAGVANAVGAVAGQVRLSASAEVAPLDNGRFRVMVGDQVADFDTESQALAHAGERAAAMAVDLALSAGAAEAHAVVTRDIRASDLDGQRFLVAATVTATASGRPRLATG